MCEYVYLPSRILHSYDNKLTTAKDDEEDSYRTEGKTAQRIQ